MLKEIDCTHSQVRKILAPYEGELAADICKGLKLSTKYQTASFAQFVNDADAYGDAVFVICLAGDDRRSAINAYLAKNQKEKLDAAINAIIQAAGVREVCVVKPHEITYAPNIADTNVQVKVIDTKRSLVLREESALYHLIESGELRSCPLEKEYPSQGCYKRPAFAADAETLCLFYTAAKAVEYGKTDVEQTKLVVINADGESRIAEAAIGTSASALLAECGIQPEKNVLIGGVTGQFVSKDRLEECHISWDAQWDSICVYSNKECLADVTRQLAFDAKEESCKKCVLCREGTWHFAAIAQDIIQGKGKKEDLAMILDIGPLIKAGAFCGFGQKAAQAMVSSVEQNRAELEAHFIKKTCPAGVCKAFAKLVIDPAKCTGCGDCIDVCEEDAIVGKKKFIHIIDTDLCENCGACADACEADAVRMQDGTVRVPKKPVKVGKFK